MRNLYERILGGGSGSGHSNSRGPILESTILGLVLERGNHPLALSNCATALFAGKSRRNATQQHKTHSCFYIPFTYQRTKERKVHCRMRLGISFSIA